MNTLVCFAAFLTLTLLLECCAFILISSEDDDLSLDHTVTTSQAEADMLMCFDLGGVDRAHVHRAFTVRVWSTELLLILRCWALETQPVGE